MQIGILDGVMRKRGEDAPWDQLYELARELGFQGMELGVFENYAETRLWREEGRRHLRDTAARVGIETPSICIHSYWKYSFADEDEATREAAGRIAAGAARAAAGVGARDILIPLTCPREVEAEIGRKRWIDGMKKAAPAAEEAGVVFCLENVGRPFANDPADIIRVVDEVGSPAVAVYYDPANAVHTDLDPLEGVSLLRDRIKHVHVKEVGGTYIGDGRVPWAEILAALQEVGYNGWLIFETDATDDPRRAAAKNLEAMRKLLAG